MVIESREHNREGLQLYQKTTRTQSENKLHMYIFIFVNLSYDYTNVFTITIRLEALILINEAAVAVDAHAKNPGSNLQP